MALYVIKFSVVAPRLLAPKIDVIGLRRPELRVVAYVALSIAADTA